MFDFKYFRYRFFLESFESGDEMTWIFMKKRTRSVTFETVSEPLFFEKGTKKAQCHGILTQLKFAFIQTFFYVKKNT